MYTHVNSFLQRTTKDVPVLIVEVKRQISDLLILTTDADVCEVLLQASYTLRNRRLDSCWFCLCDVTNFHYMRLVNHVIHS